MNHEDAEAAVGRFLMRARQQRGHHRWEDFIPEVEGLYGEPISLATMSAWGRGANRVPAWLVFRMAAEWHLSLDEFALAEEDHRSLREQLAALRAVVLEIRQVPAIRQALGSSQATPEGMTGTADLG
jgi:hypothetical protein